MVSIGLTAVAARRHGERDPADRGAPDDGDALVLALVLGGAIAVAGRLGCARDARHDGRAADAVADEGARYLGAVSARGTGAVRILRRRRGVPRLGRHAHAARHPRASPSASRSCSIRCSSSALGPMPRARDSPAPRSRPVATRSARIRRRTRRAATRRGLLAWSAAEPVVLRAGRAHRAADRGDRRAVQPRLRRGRAHRVAVRHARRSPRSGLGFRVESWLYMIGVGFGAAAAAIVGQNLGAGHVDRAARAGWLMLGYCTLPAVAVAAIALARARVGGGRLHARRGRDRADGAATCASPRSRSSWSAPRSCSKGRSAGQGIRSRRWSTRPR